MADTAFNTYGNATDLEAFLVQQDTSNAFRKLPAARVAHTINYTVADKGKIPYVASDGTITWLSPVDGSYLSWSSGVPVAATNPSALRLLSTQTVSSPVTEVVFTSIASSGYTSHTLLVLNAATDVVATTDTATIQVSTDNGSTFKTTSGDYYESGTARTSLNNARFQVAGSTSTFKYGVIECLLAGLGVSTRATTLVQSWSAAGTSTIGVSPLTQTSPIMRMAAEADNAFRVKPVTGTNFTQGTFLLYGVIE